MIAQPLAQHRRFVQAAADRVHRPEPPDRFGHAPPPTAASAPRRPAIGLERLDERAVAVLAGHQLVVWSVVDDPTVGEVHDLVGEPDRRRPRGDHQHGRADESVAEVGEHRGLGRRVQRRRGVIEQEQARPAHQCPRQGDPLALAAAEADAALPDHRVDAVRRLGDEVLGTGQAQRLPEVRVRDRLPERQVVTDRAGEEERLLDDDRPRPGREAHDAGYRRHQASRRSPRASSSRHRSDRRSPPSGPSPPPGRRCRSPPAAHRGT